MKDTKRRLMTFTFYDRTGIEKDLENRQKRDGCWKNVQQPGGSTVALNLPKSTSLWSTSLQSPCLIRNPVKNKRDFRISVSIPVGS